MFKSSQQSLAWKRAMQVTAVLITMKNNVNSTDDAARFSKFMKCVHSQRIDDEWRFHERESSSSYTRSTAIQT